MKAVKKGKAGSATDTYLALVRQFPLRQFRTEDEAAAAGETLAALMTSKPESEMSAGERDYADALSVLLRDFETKARHSFGKYASPLEALRFLMEESGMNVEDLGKVIGSQPAASMILNGKRSISKSQMLMLAARFRVSPALFMAEP